MVTSKEGKCNVMGKSRNFDYLEELRMNAITY
jgi:hypothetical protein